MTKLKIEKGRLVTDAGEVVTLADDSSPVLALMAMMGLPQDVETYIAINWCGEKSLDELGPEELAELPNFEEDDDE